MTRQKHALSHSQVGVRRERDGKPAIDRQLPSFVGAFDDLGRKIVVDTRGIRF